MYNILIDKIPVNFENVHGIKCITAEYEIISYLYRNISLSAGELSANSRASNTSFYNTLKRLHEAGVIHSRPDEVDKRITRYSLDGDTRAMLDQECEALIALVLAQSHDMARQV
ncbi:MarR family transcriptional regulator [Aquisediminimonas sediminicola]|uniref:MarR family transcriptional regulator n=1 Tax=Alteraquisediminimonas sediminicola TaxID=2676787 RepID=UPI001C8E7ED4|nr:MarR family transcriptional regulator [Aquisediminimonas sediminicola]